MPTALSTDRSTPLHLLSGTSSTVVDLLIQNRADFNAIRKRDGKSPLMACLAHIFRHEAKAMLAYGADCNLADPSGWTPLHFCVLAKIPAQGIKTGIPLFT